MDQRNVQPIIMIIYHDELGPDSWYGENHLTIIHQFGTGIYVKLFAISLVLRSGLAKKATFTDAWNEKNWEKDMMIFSKQIGLKIIRSSKTNKFRDSASL